MSRWLMLSLLATSLQFTPLSAEDAPAPAPKTKAERKVDVLNTKATAKPNSEPAKVEPLNEMAMRERASYAIGANFGSNLAQGIKEDDADVDIDVLLKGIKDALTKPTLDYTDQELNIAIESFDKALEAKNSKSSKATGDKNKKDGEAFLAKNKQEKEVQTTASGLQYKVLKSGDGKSPQKTDTVRVHYHGMLPDGSAFDSSKQRGEAVEFPVTGVIKGWSEALLKMKVGDKWILYVPANLAYGSQRRSQAIGPNQVVVFEVELLDIVRGKKSDLPVSLK